MHTIIKEILDYFHYFWITLFEESGCLLFFSVRKENLGVKYYVLKLFILLHYKYYSVVLILKSLRFWNIVNNFSFFSKKQIHETIEN